jgi:hypothetical protein
MALRGTLAERFAKYTRPSKNGCVEWTGAQCGAGYGQIRLGGAKKPRIGAHRAAWIMAHGPIPPGMFVCHRCDNKLCVAEDHLFLGSPQDNVDDAVQKGLYHYSITDTEVLRVRSLYLGGMRMSDIAMGTGLRVMAVWIACRCRYGGGGTTGTAKRLGLSPIYQKHGNRKKVA